MVEHLGEYAWVAIVMAAIGSLLAPIVGYYRRPRNGNGGQSTISGTAIIDSSIARDVVAQMAEQVMLSRRLADAAEGLLEVERGRDKRKAAERHDSEIETLRREIEDLKRSKR